MANDCFYKVKVTQNGKTETYHWGYFTWPMCLADMKQLYKDNEVVSVVAIRRYVGLPL